MLQTIVRRRALALAVTAAAASASIAYAAGGAPLDAHAQGGGGAAAASSGGGGSANIHLFTPTSGDRAGIGGTGFFLDLKADKNLPLARSGVRGPGPATRARQGQRLPSLIALPSTAQARPGKKLAR